MTHTIEQPGLHAHSWRPEDDLMKQFVVHRSRGENEGWVAVSSFEDINDAFHDMLSREDKSVRMNKEGDESFGYSYVPHRIWDQFAELTVA